MLVQAKMFMDGTGKDTENFETAIRNYIEKYQYSNAEQSELCEELNKVCSTDFEIYSTFKG